MSYLTGGFLVGEVRNFAGSTAPTGWFLCYGQAISRTTYAELFSTIGTTYGVGDGSTTFNVPDCRGRTIAGKDDMGGSAANRITAGGSGITGTTLGANGGAETHTLTTAQLAVHSHANSLSDPGHWHATRNAAGSGGGPYNTNGGDTGSYVAGGTGGGNDGAGDGHNYSHLTGITISNANQGSGSAHQNTQPTIIFNKIIKF